jgi:hypothetical protein
VSISHPEPADDGRDLPGAPKYFEPPADDEGFAVIRQERGSVS